MDNTLVEEIVTSSRTLENVGDALTLVLGSELVAVVYESLILTKFSITFGAMFSNMYRRLCQCIRSALKRYVCGT